MVRLTSIVAGTALGIAGFISGCLYKHQTNSTGPYALQEDQGLVYLVSKESGERQPITTAFQLGSPAYRLKGLMSGDDRALVTTMLLTAAENELLKETKVASKEKE